MKTEKEKVITALSSMATVPTILGKLNEINTASKDKELQKHLNPILDSLKSAYLDIAGTKNKSKKIIIDLTRPLYKAIIDYCNN